MCMAACVCLQEDSIGSEMKAMVQSPPVTVLCEGVCVCMAICLCLQEDSIGSEMKAMVQSPPRFCFV